VHRLEEAGPAVAETRRGGQAEAPGRARGHVGEDVAEGVLRQEHVELPRREHELEAAVVDEHVPELDVGVVGGDALHDLAPEPRGIEDVGLVHGGDVAPAPPRQLEAAARDALDLVRPVLHGVEDGPVVADAPGAEVEAAHELSDDEQVDPFAACGAEVRVDVELAAKSEQTLLGPDCGAVEARVADRAEEDGVGGLGGGEGLGGQRVAGGVDRRPAEGVLLQLQVERKLAQDARGGRRHLRADAVAGKERDPHRGALVTAPSEADETSAAYLAKTPCV
jgi:hypothetical protein